MSEDNRTFLEVLQHTSLNPFQLIESILSIQMRAPGSRSSVEELAIARVRVMAVTSACQTWLRRAHGKGVLIRDYLVDLLSEVAWVLDGRMDLKVDIHDFELCAETTVHIGLLVIELVISAVQGYPERTCKLPITVHLREKQSTVILRVEARGLRSETTFWFDDSSTSMANLLVSQLSASLSALECDRSAVVVQFCPKRP